MIWISSYISFFFFFKQSAPLRKSLDNFFLTNSIKSEPETYKCWYPNTFCAPLWALGLRSVRFEPPGSFARLCGFASARASLPFHHEPEADRRLSSGGGCIRNVWVRRKSVTLCFAAPMGRLMGVGKRGDCVMFPCLSYSLPVFRSGFFFILLPSCVFLRRTNTHTHSQCFILSTRTVS